MYTYVQRTGCKKVNTATYVHTGGVSNAYSRVRTARARVHGWVRTEKHHRRRVHGEPTGWVGMECVVVFIGSQPTEQAIEKRHGVLQNRRNDLVFNQPRSKQDPVHREGSGYCKTEETYLLRWKRGPVDREGCGVLQNGGNRLVLERYGRNGGPVHREGCGVPQNGTPWDTVHLHRRLPPRATVHPPLSASTGSCSSTLDLL